MQGNMKMVIMNSTANGNLGMLRQKLYVFVGYIVDSTQWRLCRCRYSLRLLHSALFHFKHIELQLHAVIFSCIPVFSDLLKTIHPMHGQCTLPSSLEQRRQCYTWVTWTNEHSLLTVAFDTIRYQKVCPSYICH